jgi:hypothetical protein
MADLTFNKKAGTLTGFSKTWTARSGIQGKYEPLTSKTYQVPHGALMTGTEEVEGVGFHKKYAASSYKDPKGFGWFLWLGVGNLGVHPDGNVPGTKGCIGVVANSTRDLFDKLKAKNDTGLTVEVVDG